MPAVADRSPDTQRRRYEQSKDTAARHWQEKSKTARDIGPIPPAANQKRRDACERNFRLFCETYFPETFYLPWSADHLTAIAKIEDAALRGGLFAFAMPRGMGKTALCAVAALWAMLYGHRRFLVIVGATDGHATEILETIKTRLETTLTLIEDFPEVCYPIRKLEGIAHRCKGQTCDGEQTRIVWSSDEIVFPAVPGSKVAGAIIRVAGITGQIRGQQFLTDDGELLRPDLVLLDDPQTDDSAESLTQCDKRERILAGAVLGLAGPGEKIAGFMPCTVIAQGDMADRVLNREKHPVWNGERTKLLYSFPSNIELWDKYRDMRNESLRAGRKGIEATEFYIDHLEAMNEGARVAWEARFEPDEVSAIQNAMNLLFRSEHAFYAEYQNEPKALESLGANELTIDQVCEKVNRIPHRLVPLEATRLTAFIDVQGSMLFYTVCAWADDFTGWVIDYGSYPDQKRPYFTVRDARLTLQGDFPTAGQEGQIYAGLERLVGKLHTQKWTRADGVDLAIERGMIDRGWGESTNTVDKFARECPIKGVWMASKGWGVRASQKPMSEYKRSPGERVGLNWRIGLGRGTQAKRFVLYDTNFWKSFVAFRLATSIGDQGCLSIYGDDSSRHRLIAEHATSEYRVRVSAPGGREVDEWHMRPDRTENHWWDCLVGCAVAASERGCVLDESRVAIRATAADGTPAFIPKTPAKPKRSWREMQAAARGIK